MNQRPRDSEIVELNGKRNFFINAGEKFFTITENGIVRTDYARRENDDYIFPVRTNNAVEFVGQANEIASRLLQALIDFYKKENIEIEDWLEFAKEEKLLKSTAFRIYRVIKGI